VHAGNDPKLVSELLGHGDPGFTLRVYVHPDDEAKSAAASAVGAVYGEALS
jgi:hypothetical protein